MASKTKTDEFDLKGDPSLGYSRLLEVSHNLGIRTRGPRGKEQKAQVACTLDRARTFRVRKIPFGVFMLDVRTEGGFPIDRITRIWGPKNSCKTTLMLKALGRAQNFCRKCWSPIVVSPDTGDKNCSCPKHRYKLVDTRHLDFLSQADFLVVESGKIPKEAVKERGKYVLKCGKHNIYFEETQRCMPMQAVLVEAEHKMDVRWAIKNGVDPRIVVVVGCDWAEETINTVIKMVQSGEIDMLFVDTITSMITSDMLQKQMEENPMVADRARLISRFMSKVIGCQYREGLMGDHPLTVMCTSQIRATNIGSRFGSKLAAVDGNMMDHVVALDIHLSLLSYGWNTAEYATSGNYEFIVNKNHTGGSSGVGGNFQMWLDPQGGPYEHGDTDDLNYVISYGRSEGVIQETAKTGSRYVIKSDFLKDGQAGFATLDDLKEFLQKNSTLFYSVRQEVLEKVIKIRSPLSKKVQKKVFFGKEETSKEESSAAASPGS